MKLIDLTGQKFSRLTVIKRVENNKHKQRMWLCKCDCGNEKIVRGLDLINGKIKSCGCLKIEQNKINLNSTSHGLTDCRLYYIWINIKTRCYNSQNKNYRFYGAKGIKMCDEWKNDFKAFYDWAYKNGYNDKAKRGECTIDRIDSNKDYMPSNCRFLNQKQQTRNMKSNHLITFNNETHCIGEWAEILNISRKTLDSRIGRGWDIKRVLTTPLMNKGK